MLEILSKLPGDNIYQKIDYFERNYDSQFKSLKKIVDIYPSNKPEIIFWAIQDALVSFQLSWKWENWHEEFSNFMIQNFDLFEEDNFLFWEKLLKNWKNNRRLIDLKLSRIRKTLLFKDEIVVNWEFYYKNMSELNKFIALKMWQPLYAKTIVFSIKFFSYVARINNNFIPFPFDISIPVDSRIKQKYFELTWKKWTDSVVRKYFNELWKNKGIPPLHLDSLLWVNIN